MRYHVCTGLPVGRCMRDWLVFGRSCGQRARGLVRDRSGTRRLDHACLDLSARLQHLLPPVTWQQLKLTHDQQVAASDIQHCQISFDTSTREYAEIADIRRVCARRHHASSSFHKPPAATLTIPCLLAPRSSLVSGCPQTAIRGSWQAE